MKPLSRHEFAAALKKGQGRAFQHIIHFGMGDYKDLVIEACLQDQNFDSQIDSSRAPWLFSMFHNTPFYTEFREAIFNGLKTSSSWDLAQQCHLLREMALAGDTLARQRLKETVFKYAAQDSEDEGIIAETFVDMQTTEEFLALARMYGNRLLEDATAFPNDVLIPEEKKQEFKDLLYHYAKKDPLIQRYWQFLDERGILDDTPKTIDRDTAKKNWHERVRQEYTLDQILKDAQSKKGDLPGRYLTFGMHATKEELDAIYASLMTEKDPEVLLRLLWVFRRAALPEINDFIFQWANGRDAGLRETAIFSLSEIHDEKVHQLAKEKVKRGDLVGPDFKVISLFQHNYENPDAQLITTALYSIEANEEDTHSLGFDLIHLSKTQSDPDLSDALKWVYEHTPCMNCRYQALLELNKYNQVDEQVAQEIPFDAEPDIRVFAGKLRKVED
jgi:hypothetical protein